MKLMIATSRSIDNIDISRYIPEDTKLIISGGAKGIDKKAEQYADAHRISKLILRPEYKLYRRRAPLIRNEEMVNTADKVLVFWDGKSRGTKYTIDYANSIGKCIEVVMVNPDA